MKTIRLSQLIKLFLRSMLAFASQKSKRMTFLASIAGQEIGLSAFDNESLKKLNEQMALCSDYTALKAPVHFSKVIWDGKAVVDIASQHVPAGVSFAERIKAIAREVVNETPSHLRYDSNQVMEQDLEKFLANKSAFAKA